MASFFVAINTKKSEETQNEDAKSIQQKIELLLAVMLLCTLGITPSYSFTSKADNTDATPTYYGDVFGCENC